MAAAAFAPVQLPQDCEAAAWARDYIGIPFEDRGNSRAGANCYGLLWLVYRERFGIELPTYDEDYVTSRDRREVGALIGRELLAGDWEEIAADEHVPGDAVVFRPAHLGIAVGAGRFLHVDGSRRTNACTERFDSPHWRYRRKSFWRYAGGDAASQISSGRSLSVQSSALIPEICAETVTVTAIVAPFMSMRVTVEVPVGMTIAEIMIELRIKEHYRTRIFIGGGLVPESLYHLVKPKAGQCVTIRVVPGFFVALIPIIIAVAQAAAAAGTSAALAGAVAAGTIAATTASTIAAVASAVVGLAGTLLMKALVPPPTPKPPKITGTPAQFSISGDTNVLAPFSPFGKIYGTRKVTPQQGSAPYNQSVNTYKAGTNEIRGSDQYLRQVFIIGYGPIDISQIKLGDSLIDTFEDVQWETRAGYLDDAPLTLYTDDIAQDAINVLLIQAPTPPTIIGYGWQQQTTGTGADEIGIDVTFPQGLYQTGAGNGGHNWAQLTINIRYAPTGTTAWVNRPNLVIRRVSVQQVLVADRWEVPRGQYDVQLQIVPRSVSIYPGIVPELVGSANPFVITCSWTALRTIRNQAPYQMAGLATLAVRIRATNQLNGPITNLNLIASSILPDWDGVSSWGHYAGSWFYDYDNSGAGAESYALDSSNPHSPNARTGSNWIVGETYGTGAGTAGPYTHALAYVPVQPGSLSVSTGIVPLIDDGLGNIYADPSAMPNYNPATVYAASEIVRYNGVVYVSLISSNVGHPPNSSPTQWAVAVTAGTINYTTGVCSVTFGSGLCAPSLAPLLANYQQQLFATGGGQDLAIKTAAGTDGAAVCGKSILVHQDPLDNETGQQATDLIGYTVSGGFRASAPISAGIRMVALFSQFEDFSISQALALDTVVIVANGAATTSWQQVSATVQAPAAPGINAGGGKENYYMRVAVYHNPDGVGGVTVYWDDISVVRSNSAQQAVNLLPNPSFDFGGNITSNPASHYRDVMEGNANKQPLTDARLDLPALEDWHLDCATNSRFNNMIIDQQTTVFDTLKTICAIGRASFRMNDGLYSVLQDQPQTTPVQHFTPRNSWGFKSTRAFPDLPGLLKVRFINPAANWQTDERWVYDDGFTAATPNLLTEAMDLTHGVTDPDQAWREGRYHLAVGRLRPEVYELTTDFESLVCTRGDLVLVAHDVPQWGLGQARIKAVQTSGGQIVSLTADEPFTMEFGNAYVLRIRCNDGTSILANLNNPATSGVDYTDINVTFATPLSSSGTQPGPEDLVMFGLSGEESVQLLVTRITTSSDLVSMLELQDYAPAIYTADSGTPPPFNYGTVPVLSGGSGQTANAAIPAPIFTSISSSKDTNPQDSAGGRQLMITIGLAQPVGPNGNPLPAIGFAGIQVQHRTDPLDGTTNNAAAYNSGHSYVAGDTVTDLTTAANIWIANEAVPAGNAPGSLDGSGNPYWAMVDFDADWSAIAVQPYGTQALASPIELGHLYDVRLRYVMNDGTTSAWTQDEVLCTGTATVDNLVDGVNFRLLGKVTGVYSFLTFPLSVPGGGAKVFIGTVNMEITDLTAPLFFSVSWTLASSVADQFDISICEDSIFYNASQQVSGGRIATTSDGVGHFTVHALPLASLGLGPQAFQIFINASGTTRSLTSVVLNGG